MRKKKYIPPKEKIRPEFNKKKGYVRDFAGVYSITTAKQRREFGAHLTSIDIFKNFILPEIKNYLWEYTWIDLFAGEGNLILPILGNIPIQKRAEFFKEHIFMFDIQPEMIEKTMTNAKNYNIPMEVINENIKVRDTLKDYPTFIKDLKYPPFHITNPPYLYLGYIMKNSKRNLQYFSGSNEGYQDLYQIALMNDLRNGIEKMIYIIPTNFLFGFSVSNKFRSDFLSFYSIKKAIIFERKVFEFTGTNVCICFFERKEKPKQESVIFKALKINNNTQTKTYHLKPENFYRAGGEFDDFVSKFKSNNPLKISFYLTLRDVLKNKGEIPVKLLDINSFSNGYFKFEIYDINQKLYKKLKQNPLFVRTLDTGSWEGRVGIYNVKETFGVEGIVVTKEKYRTHPIQIFLQPDLSDSDLTLLKNYFNTMLEYFRNITDSEFLTTFKYSNSDYIRKYLGLSQTKKIIETFPIYQMNDKEKKILNILIEQKNIEEIKNILFSIKHRYEKQLSFI